MPTPTRRSQTSSKRGSSSSSGGGVFVGGSSVVGGDGDSLDKDDVIDEEVEWINKQAGIQSFIPHATPKAPLSSSIVRGTTPPMPPPKALHQSEAATSRHFAPTTTEPYDGLRNTISDMSSSRPVPETLQEARELIRKTQRY
jgi:hypothetical protein